MLGSPWGFENKTHNLPTRTGKGYRINPSRVAKLSPSGLTLAGVARIILSLRQLQIEFL
jgi:hypothetical protein